MFLNSCLYWRNFKQGFPLSGNFFVWSFLHALLKQFHNLIKHLPTVLYILCKSLPCSLPNFTWYMTSHAVWHPIGMCPFKTCSCLDVSNGILNSQVSTVFKFVILIPLWFVINSGNFVKQSKPLHVFWHSFRQKMSQCEWLNS